MKERYLLEEEVGENGFSLITDYDGNDEHVFDVNIKSGDILPVLAILLASFMIKTACGEMGLSEYVINLCVPYMNAKTLAAIIFVVIAVLTFVTSSFWGIEAVAVSIVVPLASALGANVLLALGAVVSGGVFGSHACFYSDATVLSSATCEIDNMSHAVSQFPYVLISAALAIAGFLICGIFAL